MSGFQIVGLVVAVALVIGGGLWFWQRAQERKADEEQTLRPPTPRPPRPDA